ncbi:carbohydrate-binding module family 43 protein [Durotheca rogersii]|uniref:carbohydrate-binding module family 43 protein n=1 Tax=Durotheca rogersii TaxID=419775 RepID=UPI00221E6EDC|nr:carbohydrate-binding module family 43 protein [Durotheca rogersii]KAI5866295.1 carbohydrate-binding module family 43 protein [Durotheca rogersii]
MWASSALPHLAFGLAALSGARGQSYNDIPAIEAYGQHFFYTNNGSQFYMRGVAYQENYNPNGTANNDPNVQYTDPLADASKCRRDIPFLRQIFTNVIRVYAIDPARDHDDCMAELASNGIYVIADLGHPGVSIDSNNAAWDVELYTRYTAVIDTMSKYNNVIGFFAGNEVVSATNQTYAAAFVKAAVRDTKAYIRQMNYRQSLGVGYATADVPSRDELAHYFACEPEQGSSTTIDFWGYNVYSWCGDSNYEASSYGERVQFFSDYPVPVFFAEYGCIEGIDGGPTHRPFTEVAVLYGNMTSVFSGGIVYQYFMSENNYGLVEVDGDSVSPYPDFTSLSSQLARVTPSLTVSSAYTPTNSPPACPTVGGTTWAAAPSPLPPAVNPRLCACEVASLQCVVTSDDEDSYADVFDYICGSNQEFCAGIDHNSTRGEYGALGGCNPKDQLAWVANQYYLGNNGDASACDFNGLAQTQSPTTSEGCEALISAAGTNGQGTVPSPTGRQGTESAGGASSSSEGRGSVTTPAFFSYGKAFFVAYVVTALVSGVGIFVL